MILLMLLLLFGQWSTGHVISQSPDYVTPPDWLLHNTSFDHCPLPSPCSFTFSCVIMIEKQTCVSTSSHLVIHRTWIPQ